MRKQLGYELNDQDGARCETELPQDEPVDQAPENRLSPSEYMDRIYQAQLKLVDEKAQNFRLKEEVVSLQESLHKLNAKLNDMNTEEVSIFIRL